MKFNVLALFLFVFLVNPLLAKEKNYGSIFYSDDAERYLESWESNKEWSDVVIQAQSKYKAKLYQEAIPLYKEAFSLGYESGQGLFNLAHAYKMVGELEQAIKTYKASIKELESKGFINETLYEAHFHVGLYYAEKQKYAKALKYLNRARQINATQPELLFNLGVVYQKRKNKEEAKKYYQATLGLDPTFKEAKENLNLLQANRQSPEIGLTTTMFKFKTPVEMAPLNKLKASQIREKITHLEQSIATADKKQKKELHFELALYYFTARQYPLSLENLKKAGSFAKNSYSDFLFGTIYLKTGETKKGIAAYKRYLRKNPKDSLGHYNLAVFYDNHTSKTKRAIHHYHRYLQIAKARAKDADDVGRRIYILKNYRNP